MDKTSFKAQTFKEAGDQRAYWLQKTVKERLRAAWYLISAAWGFPPGDPPRMDKNAFSMRKHRH